MLHADPFHNFCVALVVAAPHALEEWALKRAISYSDFSDLCQKEETVKEVHGSLIKVGVPFSLPSMIHTQVLSFST